MRKEASIARDNEKHEYVITLPYGFAPHRVAFHRVVGIPILLMHEMVRHMNNDGEVLRNLERYTERLDKTLDAYHNAPLWKRVWWALCNDMPYPATEG